MEKITFTGYVRKIFEADTYRRDFVVSNYKDEEEKEAFKSSKENFPVVYKVSASTHNNAASQLDDLHEGDKVKVTFFLKRIEVGEDWRH